jgi:hypothetical protein
LGVSKPTPWSACTAQRSDGSFCDAKSLPDAPFPICVHHASEIYGFIRDTANDKFRRPRVDVELTPAQAEIQSSCEDLLDRYIPPPPVHVVYYVRLADMIKIGTSACIEIRMGSYPPSAVLLATEPGGRELETQRLSEFKQYKHSGREWFTPGPLLIWYINRLRMAAGDEPFKPPIAA